MLFIIVTLIAVSISINIYWSNQKIYALLVAGFWIALSTLFLGIGSLTIPNVQTNITEIDSYQGLTNGYVAPTEDGPTFYRDGGNDCDVPVIVEEVNYNNRWVFPLEFSVDTETTVCVPRSSS